MKDIVNKVNKHPKNQEKAFVLSNTDEVLICRIYEKCLQVNIDKEAQWKQADSQTRNPKCLTCT